MYEEMYEMLDIPKTKIKIYNLIPQLKFGEKTTIIINKKLFSLLTQEFGKYKTETGGFIIFEPDHSGTYYPVEVVKISPAKYSYKKYEPIYKIRTLKFAIIKYKITKKKKIEVIAEFHTHPNQVWKASKLDIIRYLQIYDMFELSKILFMEIIVTKYCINIIHANWVKIDLTNDLLFNPLCKKLLNEPLISAEEEIVQTLPPLLKTEIKTHKHSLICCELNK